MRSSVHGVLYIGVMLQTLGVTPDAFNQPHNAKIRPGKRNSKFIIPALISHMYRQRLDESPLSALLNKPFAKRVGKENNGELEHKTIVGNPKGNERVRPQHKNLRQEDKIEKVQSHNAEDKISNIDRRSGNVIEVSKHFSPLHKNWYTGASSVMWPAYPNSYGTPLEQYPRLSRPIYPGSTALHQEGVIQHMMAPTRNIFSMNNLKGDGLVAQERKFMVTNITKYVMDFYCPHCGGEISVSKNRNRGGIFGADQGGISVNKGAEEPKSQKTTTSYSEQTKTQPLN